VRNPVRTIRWKLIVSSLLAIGIPLMAFAYYLSSLLWDFYLQQLEQELRSKAHIIAEMVASPLSPETPDNPEQLSRNVDRWRTYTDMRVTIMDDRGIVRAATTAGDVGAVVVEEERPGLLAAFHERETNSTIWKNPKIGNQDTMYVNVPVIENDRAIGAIRVAYTLTQIQENIRDIRFALMAGGAAYTALLVGLTIWLAGTIARPVEDLKRSAERLAAGDLGYRVPTKGTEEIIQLANTLNQMTERLQHLEGMRRQYVSNVSHELRTPLASIRGMAETLQQHGDTDPELRERYLPRIIAQTDRLARLASQLLDLAQIESGNLVDAFAAVSLPSVIEEAAETCRDRAQLGAVRIRLETPLYLPDVLGDRDRLVQVFVNLIDNAVRYTPEGGTITVSARCEDGMCTAAVEDTGAGIAPEHVPRLFERFYRVEESRSLRTGGTGLGLSIVREIVEAHGGRITVESAVGRGTRFELTIPVAETRDGGDRRPTLAAVGDPGG
jgi:signal transduction histidine kinase